MLSVILAAVLSPDDPDLIARLKEKNHEAIGEVYDRYGKLAYSVTLRITRNQQTAEDLVQEVFLRVWNRAHKFDSSRGSLGMWILCIARNVAIDHLRSTATRIARRQSTETDLEKLCFHDDFVSRISIMQQMKAVRAAAANLNANQRSVLELAYFEGLTHSEIAERLNQPLGTIKTWVRTALISIRSEMTQAASR
ncbi:MAG TPA: sigma-70 family RNA polymerase sigma factor [Bryobacteraceae bacterium]|nr:sigma-70 family RNA polymerase sigma factor [Bryobacteraceae bacterium]